MKFIFRIGTGFIVLTVALLAVMADMFAGSSQKDSHGVVASDVPECSDIGASMLKQGGSAVDAAIAAVFCIQVINFQSSGIGGGGFALVFNYTSKESFYLNFRETAPIGFAGEMMEQLDSQPVLSVAVPGELRGLSELHSRYGKLSWLDLIMPSVALARNGFRITQPLAADVWRFDERKDQPSSQRLKELLYPNGVPLGSGQIVRRPEFADTLERIAREGIEDFYSGALAEEIVREVQKFGGVMTKDDLRNYRTRYQQPLTSIYGKYQVITAPPPSAGAMLLLGLNILEGFKLTPSDVNTTIFWHRFVETLKFMDANKVRLGDPDAEPEAAEIALNITRKEFAEELRLRMKSDSTLDSYGPNVTQPGLWGTSHISAVDDDDLYISLTTSINNYCGSGLMTPSGIILNDQMGDFAHGDRLEEEQRNLVKPGKRALSTMMPTIVYHLEKNDGLRLAVGGSNGSNIPSGMLNTLLNLLSFDMNLKDAIDFPRVHTEKPDDDVHVEETLDREMIEALKSFGHKIKMANDGLSVIQGAVRVKGTTDGHSDPRKFGQAAVV